MKLKNVRLSFPHLFKPNPRNENNRYSCMFILDADDPQIAEIQAEMDKAAKEEWPKGTPKTCIPCLRSGEEKDDLDGFDESVMFFNASSSTQPTLVDSNRTPLQESDGRLYAGCYVNAVVEFWAQNNDFGKRINASLLGVQFYRDGEAFGGGKRASIDEFDDVSEIDEEDVLA